MKSWSLIRKKLEQEYLADSLKGHIKYFATRYRDGHDEEGRASILFDGKEIIKGNFWKYQEHRHVIEESLQSENMLVKMIVVLEKEHYSNYKKAWKKSQSLFKKCFIFGLMQKELYSSSINI